MKDIRQFFKFLQFFRKGIPVLILDINLMDTCRISARYAKTLAVKRSYQYSVV